MESITGKPFFCSWSGGKDSCLSLYHAIQSKGIPKTLFTMLTDEGEHSHSHHLSLKVLERQAASLGLPLMTAKATWNTYEVNFLEVLNRFKRDEIEWGVFGDIDLEDHRIWCQRVCMAAGLKAFHPIWQRPRLELVEELIGLGFKSSIVAVKEGMLPVDLLGKTLCTNVIQQIVSSGADAAGENGEYHTLITGGPIFTFEIPCSFQPPTFTDGYWFSEPVLLD